jgi:hypothetical protein
MKQGAMSDSVNLVATIAANGHRWSIHYNNPVE